MQIKQVIIRFRHARTPIRASPPNQPAFHETQEIRLFVKASEITGSRPVMTKYG